MPVHSAREADVVDEEEAPDCVAEFWWKGEEEAVGLGCWWWGRCGGGRGFADCDYHDEVVVYRSKCILSIGRCMCED